MHSEISRSFSRHGYVRAAQLRESGQQAEAKKLKPIARRVHILERASRKGAPKGAKSKAKASCSAIAICARP